MYLKVKLKKLHMMFLFCLWGYHKYRLIWVNKTNRLEGVHIQYSLEYRLFGNIYIYQNGSLIEIRRSSSDFLKSTSDWLCWLGLRFLPPTPPPSLKRERKNGHQWPKTVSHQARDSLDQRHLCISSLYEEGIFFHPF